MQARVLSSTVVCLVGGLAVAALLTLNAIGVRVIHGSEALAVASIASLALSYFGVALIAALLYGPVRAFLPTLAGAIGAGVVAGGLGLPVLIHAFRSGSPTIWEPVFVFMGVFAGGLLGAILFRDAQPPSAYQRWLSARNLSDG